MGMSAIAKADIELREEGEGLDPEKGLGYPRVSQGGPLG